MLKIHQCIFKLEFNFNFFSSQSSQSSIYGFPCILIMNGLVSHTIKNV
jgi:hypothetical protein